MSDLPDEVLHPFEAEKRQRAFILTVVRWVFFASIIGFALLTILRATNEPNTGQPVVDLAIQWWIPVGVAICMFLIAYLVDRYTPNKKVSTITGVFLGLVVGMLATVVLGLVLDLLLQTWGINQTAIDYLKPLMGTIKVMVGLCLCYLGVTTVLQTQDDFRIVIPYVEFAKQIRGVRPIVLDTSALIDGRVADVASTGLIQAPIVVPRFVLAELQLMADAGDKLKRAKGRRGLDVVARLQRQGTIDVKIDDTRVSALSVDQMLVELAEKLGGGRLMTTDLALTRVAQIHGVMVLNLHEIANTLKPTLVSGQQLLLRMVKPGEQPGQAVGYLEDGTMVVADGAAHKIGQDALLLVTGSMQTTAGRLVFARLLDPSELEPGAEIDAAPDAVGDEELEDDEPRSADPGGVLGRGFDESPDDAAPLNPPASPTVPPAPSARKPGPPATPKGAPPPYRRPGSPRNPRR
jgi:uncharacterized protein YacL